MASHACPGIFQLRENTRPAWNVLASVLTVLRSSLDQHRYPGTSSGFWRPFGHSFLAGLSGQARDEYLHEVRLLLEPQLVNADGAWVADYVRLRFSATKA